VVTADELAALVARTRAGDPRARHALLVELYGAVRKHVYLLLGSGAMADDAVQDTMIALYRGLPAFRGEASARTWALSIATRTAWRVRRREARYQPVVEDGIAWFDLSPTEAAELAMLRRALAKLAPKKRDAFVPRAGRARRDRQPRKV
jgi:RNA polymerase sigma-70 factor (ECF subfamily)